MVAAMLACHRITWRACMQARGCVAPAARAQKPTAKSIDADGVKPASRWRACVRGHAHAQRGSAGAPPASPPARRKNGHPPQRRPLLDGGPEAGAMPAVPCSPQ
eukprot:362816-Chlamydomonas_euryale.AAC.7